VFFQRRVRNFRDFVSKLKNYATLGILLKRSQQKTPPTNSVTPETVVEKWGTHFSRFTLTYAVDWIFTACLLN
jgi:hypothetical protein